MRPLVTASTFTALALAAGTCLAQDAAAPADRQARAWSATCAACHGTDGRAQGSIPALTGMTARQVQDALMEFKNGQRPAATVMHQHAKGYTDDEIRRIAQAVAGAAANR